MNNSSKIIIVVFVIAIMGLGGVLHSQGYLEVLIPQPKISIVVVSISYLRLGCYVSFDLVNSGDIDGFVEVDIRSGYLIEQYRYFIESNTIEEKNIWVDNISSDRCNKQNSEITISKIDRG